MRIGPLVQEFRCGEIEPELQSINPAFLGLVGRSLVRRGESVFVIGVERGRIQLQPVGSWDVRGGSDPSRWFYRCDVYGPSGNQTRFLPGASVLHFKWGVDPSRPWHGLGPLAYASLTGRLLGNLEQRLGEEAGAAVGHLLPIPQDGGDGGDDDPLADLKASIANLKGQTGLLETTAAGWGEGRASAPQADYVARRIGANPPATLSPLRTEAAMAVLSACGVPVSLMTDADGTSQRESWRRFYHGKC